MRDNPMCAGCVRLDVVEASPFEPCPVCGFPQQQEERVAPPEPKKSKLARAVEIARGGPPPGRI